MIENIISVKKLVILPFLVFGQFIVNAQKPTQKSQHVITLNLLPAGPVHLPKKNNGNNGNGKDKTLITESKVELSQDKQSLSITQVTETVTDDKNATKTRSVIYTVTSL